MSSQQQRQGEPREAYELHRSDADEAGMLFTADDYSSYSVADQSSNSEAYLDIHTAAGDSTVITAAHIRGSSGDPLHTDATEAVHEMHLALLYLLSNPEEFERAVARNNMSGAATTTLAQWNAEYSYGDNESLYTDTDSVQQQSPQRGNHHRTSYNNADNNNIDSSSSMNSTPLPYAVFADDAEVVLPQAHTASQLFGLETVTGMELEAAAGVPALSQLFLRWLALMPGGDHLNLIDPPGLTVMRIAGGRYRVTAAHKVVWTWMNEFAPVQSSADSESAPAGGVHTLQVGDLVSMTIVDVFESDNQGKLLSYCPTFDNRAVLKTDRTAHAIRLKTGALKKAFKTARNSKLAIAVAAYTSALAQQFRQRVDDAVHNYNSNSSSTKNHHDSPATSHTEAPDHYHEEERKEPLYHYEATHATTTTTNSASARTVSKLQSAAGTSTYMGDDDMERHEV